MDFNTMFFGARLIYWFYLFLSASTFFGIVLYWKREFIKKHYYLFRYPEKTIKVVVHYKNNIFKEYYRIIPSDKYFILEGFRYCYSDERIIKDNDFFMTQARGRNVIKIGKLEFDFHDLGVIRKRKSVQPEIHFFYNNPNPIIFDTNSQVLELSAKELSDFKENDLFAKLLTLETERTFLLFILIIGIVTLLISIVILAKVMGWIKQ